MIIGNHSAGKSSFINWCAASGTQAASQQGCSTHLCLGCEVCEALHTPMQGLSTVSSALMINHRYIGEQIQKTGVAIETRGQ